MGVHVYLLVMCIAMGITTIVSIIVSCRAEKKVFKDDMNEGKAERELDLSKEDERFELARECGRRILLTNWEER